MSRIPATLKAWKTPVTELFNDNKLFTCSPGVAESWMPIVRALFDLDKAAFPELLGAWLFFLRVYAFVHITGRKGHDNAIGEYLHQS